MSPGRNAIINKFLLYIYQVNELYVELEDFDNNREYARYDAFSIGSDIEEYRISLLGTYEGTAGISKS